MLSCKRVEERGEPPFVKRVLVCGLTVNPGALGVDDVHDFDARPSMRVLTSRSSSDVEAASEELLQRALHVDLPVPVRRLPV